MLHGIIDIGSNTIRMAIYFIEGQQIEMLMKKKHIVGLASYLKDGVMQPAGIDAAVAVLQEFKVFLQTFQIDSAVAFTTAALRNAKNSKAAVNEIERRTGINIRVITGDEEATFDFIGATHDIKADSGLLIDIGGGSTEIVAYKARKITQKISLPLGSLAFHTKYVKGVLPTSEECQQMYKAAGNTINAVNDFAGISEASIAGIGGTFKGANALYNEMFQAPLANNCMQADKLAEIIETFKLDKGITQAMTIMMMRTVPDRMHTVIPGLIIADVLAKHFQSHIITYSDSGVREGYIYSEIVKAND